MAKSRRAQRRERRTYKKWLRNEELKKLRRIEEQILGFHEHHIIKKGRAHGKLLEQLALWDVETILPKVQGKLDAFNGSFNYLVQETRAAAAMLGPELQYFTTMEESLPQLEERVLHAWKKTKPAGGRPPSQRSRQG